MKIVGWRVRVLVHGSLDFYLRDPKSSDSPWSAWPKEAAVLSHAEAAKWIEEHGKEALAFWGRHDTPAHRTSLAPAPVVMRRGKRVLAS